MNDFLGRLLVLIGVDYLIIDLQGFRLLPRLFGVTGLLKEGLRAWSLLR
jgi:hypothetical protein